MSCQRRVIRFPSFSLGLSRRLCLLPHWLASASQGWMGLRRCSSCSWSPWARPSPSTSPVPGPLRTLSTAIIANMRLQLLVRLTRQGCKAISAVVLVNPDCVGQNRRKRTKVGSETNKALLLSSDPLLIHQCSRSRYANMVHWLAPSHPHNRIACLRYSWSYSYTPPHSLSIMSGNSCTRASSQAAHLYPRHFIPWCS